MTNRPFVLLIALLLGLFSFPLNPVSAQSNQPAETSADLSVRMSVSKAVVSPGDIVIFTVTVTNDGPDAVYEAIFKDKLSPSLVNVSWVCKATQAVCVPNGAGSIEHPASFLNGGFAVYTISGTLVSTTAAALNNSASISLPAGVVDPNPGNNVALRSAAIIFIPVTGGSTLFIPAVTR